MPKLRYLAALLIISYLPASALAQSPARTMLDGMSKAFRELDYHGVFTYEYGAEMESMRIIHAVRDGVEVERLIYLNGEPREVFRHGHLLECVHPGDQILRLGHTISSGPFSRSFLKSVGNIEDHYEITQGGSKRIAGKMANELRIRPKDKYRNGFWFYLDQDSSLLLKSTIISPEGRPLERFQFASVEIGVEIDDADLVSDKAATEDTHQILAQTMSAAKLANVEGMDLAVTWLPPGFTIAARSETTNSGGPLRLALYTDGLASLSVFIEQSQAVDENINDGGGRARHGATVAYTHKMMINDKPYNVTVVGEVPLFTAARVARYVKAQAAVN
ncbi:MAG: sigma-E factor negative regulatory protein RseB [Pseudomonadales bacterium]